MTDTERTRFSHWGSVSYRALWRHHGGNWYGAHSTSYPTPEAAQAALDAGNSACEERARLDRVARTLLADMESVVVRVTETWEAVTPVQKYIPAPVAGHNE